MILLPRDDGTVKAPPLINVPGGEVVKLRVWQTAHPTELKRLEPATVSESGGPLEPSSAPAPRGGALVALMKVANKATSSFPSSSGSGTVSNAATDAPFEVFSVGRKELVIPISLR